MRKIVMGIVAIVIASLLITSAGASDWTIEGDKVYIDDSNVYLSAEPYSISSSGWVYFNLTTKSYNGDVDVLWGFDGEVAKPSKPQVPDGWVNKTSSTTFYNVTSFEDTSNLCEYGHGYNTYKKLINYNVNESRVICFDSYSPTPFVSGGNYTIYWHTAVYRNWNDISPSLFSSLNYEYQGMNKWYYIEDVSVVAGESKELRIWIKVPIGFEDVSGKYWWALKPSSESISQAIAAGHFYTLDPWYSASWSHRKQWTVTNVNATTLTNYAAYINVTDGPEMQADWDDVVFTDSAGTKIPYELENYTTGFGDYWVNVTIPASSSVTGWTYYGNDGASSQENPEGVYDSNTKMVHHLQDLNDSTSNDNDATNHGATYISSGQVDGAYDFNDTASNYWDCGNSESLNLTDAITIEAWVKSNNIAASRSIVTRGYTWNWWASISGSKISFRQMNIDSDTTYKYGNTVLQSDTWYHITIVYVDSEKKVYFYLNGTSDGSETYTKSMRNTNWQNCFIGGYGIGTTLNFNGTIDEVRIYNRALSADEINQSYQLVTNQSTWVSWGSAEQYPSTPTNLGATTGNFWVNWTWTEGSGYPLETDSYNVTNQTEWFNGTDTYYNETVGAHEWVNISVWAWNSTENNLSESSVSGQQQIPNNPIYIINCSDWSGEDGEEIIIDFNFTDIDGDSGTFDTNASDGSLNTSTGIFNWSIPINTNDVIYHWKFNVTDGYGSTDDCTVTITITRRRYNVSGYVIDLSAMGISDASVTTGSEGTTTNSTGWYTLFLVNDTHTITAIKGDGMNSTDAIVNGADVTDVNITLSILEITSTVGSTWIKWVWSSGANAEIWIDGTFVQNSTLGTYTLSDLNSREEHTLHLFYNNSLVASSTVKTFYPVGLFYVLLILLFVFLLLTVLLRSGAYLSILFGTITFVLGILLFFMSYPYHFSIIAFLCIAVAVIAFIWVMMAAFTLVTSSKNEEDDWL